MFFFEKKNCGWPSTGHKSLLLLFFRKEDLPFFTVAA
jgi:hypothetical protein